MNDAICGLVTGWSGAVPERLGGASPGDTRLVEAFHHRPSLPGLCRRTTLWALKQRRSRKEQVTPACRSTQYSSLECRLSLNPPMVREWWGCECGEVPL